MYCDNIKLADSCYKKQYTADCHKSLMTKVLAFFIENFEYKDRKIAKLKDTQNIMEVIILMLSLDATKRPSASDVLEKLQKFVSSFELI